MPKTSTYLYAVQDETGREVLSAYVTTDKVSSVKATRQDDGHIVLKQGSKLLASSAEPRAEDDKLFLHRWLEDDKLSKPVSSTV